MAKTVMDNNVLIAFFAIAVAAVVLVTSGVLSPTGTSVLGPSGEAIVREVGCPPYEEAQAGLYAVTSITYWNGSEVPVSTSGAVYLQGATVADHTLTSSTTGTVWSNASAGQEMTCGDVFKIIVGDGSTYYYADNIDGSYITNMAANAAGNDGTGDAPTWWTMDSRKTGGKYVIDKVGTITVTGSNDTHPGWLASNGLNHTMGASETDTDIHLRVCDTGTGVIRKPAFFIDANTTVFAEIQVVGAQGATVPNLHSAADWGYSGGVDYIKDNGCAEYTLKIVSVSNPANQTVTVYVDDLANFVQDGTIKEGYENLAHQAIGASAATYKLEIE